MMSKRCLHVFNRSIIQSRCNSRLAHCNTLCRPNPSPQLRPFSSLPARIVQFQTASTTSSLPAFLQFARTQLRNATHRDVLRSRYSSPRRPPRRPNWLDSINGNVIFVAVIAINAGVFLLWQGAKSTYVRRRYAFIETKVQGAADSHPQQTTRDPTLWIFLRNNFLVNWENITSGRVWTLITSCFSHQDIEHILFNGLSFYFMAPGVMQVLGNSRFLGLYFLGGIASSVTSLVWNRFYKRESNYSSHGASGAILATIAFYACAFPRTRFLIFFVIPCPAWAFLPGILAFDVYRSVTDARTTTDTAGHVGGMLSGISFFLWRVALRR